MLKKAIEDSFNPKYKDKEDKYDVYNKNQDNVINDKNDENSFETGIPLPEGTSFEKLPPVWQRFAKDLTYPLLCESPEREPGSINGLNVIKKGSKFRLASFITGGNFFLVSYDKEESHIPSSSDKFISLF